MGDQAVIFELQGNLFFGNTYQLYADLEQEISTRRYVIIDLKHVQSIDMTAAQLFNQIRDADPGARREAGAERHPATTAANGSNLQRVPRPDRAGQAESKTVRVFPDLDSAIAWVEDRLLRGSETGRPKTKRRCDCRTWSSSPGYKDETLNDLEAAMQVRSYAAGETIYPHGSPGDELYWVPKRHGPPAVTSFGKGAPGRSRASAAATFSAAWPFSTANPVQTTRLRVKATELYVLSREQFDRIARDHRTLAFNLTMAMARTLARRLRRTENKLTTVQEY